MAKLTKEHVRALIKEWNDAGDEPPLGLRNLDAWIARRAKAGDALAKALRQVTQQTGERT
jgi:hypothetical protein